MIRSFRKFGLSIMVMCLVMATSGCIPLLIGAAAGAGGVAYVRGALAQNIDETVQDLHSASLEALKDLGLFVESDELNRHSSLINAEYGNGKKIKINIEALTEYVSKISIRVGMVGDQEDSRMILNAIQKKL